MPRTKIKIITDACRKPDIPDSMGKGASACGVLMLDEDGNTVSKASKYLGYLTIPQAEYRAVIFGLDQACGIGRYRNSEVEVWTDSELVVKHMNFIYGIKSENIKPLYDELKKIENRFPAGTVSYFHHPREAKLAKEADKLAEEEFIKNNS